MAPVRYVAVNVGQLPCNGSDVIIVGFLNSTSPRQEEELDDYDYNGAMKFIVTTLMVYSLMGISGLLLQRIRRHASKTHRVVSIREEHLQQYIKRADDLKLAGYRHKLKMDASRMVHHLQNLERQKSYIRNDSQQNNGPRESATLLPPVAVNGTHESATLLPPVAVNGTHESATLLPPVAVNGQQSHHSDFPNGCPNSGPLISPEVRDLNPLISPEVRDLNPHISPEVRVLNPLSGECYIINPLQVAPASPDNFSFCSNCGAPFSTDSPDQYQRQFEWGKSLHSPTCNVITATGNDGVLVALDGALQADKRSHQKHVTISAI